MSTRGLAVISAMALAVGSFTLAPSAAANDADTRDRITLTNGKVVEGEVIEDRGDSIVFKVIRPGFPEATTTYPRSSVLAVEIDAAAAATGGSTATRAAEEVAALPDSMTKIYHVELEGVLGYDLTTFYRGEQLGVEKLDSISETPLEDLFADVDNTFNDLIEQRTPSGEVIKVVDPSVRDKHVVVLEYNVQSPWYQAEGIFAAEEIGPLFEKEIRDKGRRVVFWVEEGVDGGSFIPWISPEIVFKTDGRMYFKTDLDNFKTGDRMVEEKLISARFGHADGFAVTGGHGASGPYIMKAMARGKYWLAYKIENGQPKYIFGRRPNNAELNSGYQVLSVAGAPFVFTGVIAHQLGISKTPADTMEQLMASLGIGEYHVVKNIEGQEILTDWADDVDEAADEVKSLFVDLARRIEAFQNVGGNDGRAMARRNQLRGEVISTLRKLRTTFNQYEEALDADGQIQAAIRTQEDYFGRANALDPDFIAQFGRFMFPGQR